MTPDAGLSDLRSIGHHLYATGCQRCPKARRKPACAKPVHQHAHGDAPLRGAHQRRRDQPPSGVVGKNIGLEMHLMPRPVDRGNQCGKILASRFEQLQAIARKKVTPGGMPRDRVHGTAILT